MATGKEIMAGKVGAPAAATPSSSTRASATRPPPELPGSSSRRPSLPGSSRASLTGVEEAVADDEEATADEACVHANRRGVRRGLKIEPKKAGDDDDENPRRPPPSRLKKKSKPTAPPQPPPGTGWEFDRHAQKELAALTVTKGIERKKREAIEKEEAALAARRAAAY